MVIICRDVVNKKSVLENLDLVLITIDETVDQGYVSWSGASLLSCQQITSAHRDHPLSLQGVSVVGIECSSCECVRGGFFSEWSH